jgi:Zn finger protein HypA/HybF involved in hydrogenase expression
MSCNEWYCRACDWSIISNDWLVKCPGCGSNHIYGIYDDEDLFESPNGDDFDNNFDEED